MFKVIFITVFFILKESWGIIYKANESEYYKMPELFAMDNYQACMQPGGVYCLASYYLHSRSHSDLLYFIEEYSNYKLKHFNHTHLHRATCVTSTCISYLNKTLETTPDLNKTLERCINETIWKEYKIEAKLTNILYCKEYDNRVILDPSDYIIAVVYALIIILNVIGSFYDIIICEKDNKTGNPYILAFSLPRNWTKLTAPSGVGPDSRYERLKLFNGLRALTMVCVIFSHTALVMSFTYIQNPLYIETTYEDPLKQLLFNGSLVTHTFFVLSSFLLAYNLQIHAEKQEVTWVHIPKGIIFRWIRLTPTYALVLATISTWMRHLGSGPLWDLVVTSESNFCRQYWWANIFYFNNYLYYKDRCFPQAWYLAADTQLFCLALILLVIVQNQKYRKVLLILLFLISLVITGASTYFFNLDAVVLQSPETYRTVYAHDDTFNLVYIRGHTNLSAYILGLTAGLLTYKWQMEGNDLSKLKKYRWVMWTLFPLGVLTILSGGFFYIDDYTPSTLIIVLYASLYKPIFQIILLTFIVGCIFKFEPVQRKILEWRGFTWAGRVTYCAFLLHTVFQRTYVGSQTTPLVMSDYFVMMLLCSSIFFSYACGAILWLCVEAPVAGLMRAILAPKKNNMEK
ncbi:unnamed protein product, partial [Brenthis ino]